MRGPGLSKLNSPMLHSQGGSPGDALWSISKLLWYHLLLEVTLYLPWGSVLTDDPWRNKTTMTKKFRCHHWHYLCLVMISPQSVAGLFLRDYSNWIPGGRCVEEVWSYNPETVLFAGALWWYGEQVVACYQRKSLVGDACWSQSGNPPGYLWECIPQRNRQDDWQAGLPTRVDWVRNKPHHPVRSLGL